MLGYISSTRKKSCHACVKAKRRCDLGYPFCKRCFVKGLDCTYPNAQKKTVRDAEVIIRQSTPDFTPATTSVTSSLPDAVAEATPIPGIDADIDPIFLQSDLTRESETGSSSPETWPTDWRHDWSKELKALKQRRLPTTQLCKTLLPEHWAPSILNDAQVVAVIRGLCAFVPDMAFSGSTTFLHPNLYQSEHPQAYQDCVALSALYLTKNPRNQAILASSMHAKIAGLIAGSSSWTLVEHLAAVQALIVYQIIRLFDPDLQMQAHAEKHNALLELWSAHLWKRFFLEPQSFKTSHQAWVFNESLRRTFLISVFTRCGWSVFTKGGLADQIPVLVRLPFTKDLEAWECGPEDWGMRSLNYITEEEKLVAYGDLEWTLEREVEGMDPFEKLLLVPCVGGIDPRLLS